MKIRESVLRKIIREEIAKIHEGMEDELSLDSPEDQTIIKHGTKLYKRNISGDTSYMGSIDDFPEFKSEPDGVVSGPAKDFEAFKTGKTPKSGFSRRERSLPSQHSSSSLPRRIG